MLELFVTLQLLGQRVGERLRREDGATAVEYGLLVALIAAIIVGVVGVLGTNLRDAFFRVCSAVGGPTACPGGPPAAT